MIILDTDHISVLQHPGTTGASSLHARLDSHPDSVATTAVTLEEQSRSWISLIGRYADVERQVAYYRRLTAMFDFFADWEIVPFDEVAAAEFKRLRGERVRVATTDLKIAAIALTNDATLLSANLRDFERVPDLKVENWLNS